MGGLESGAEDESDATCQAPTGCRQEKSPKPKQTASQSAGHVSQRNSGTSATCLVELHLSSTRAVLNNHNPTTQLVDLACSGIETRPPPVPVVALGVTTSISLRSASSKSLPRTGLVIKLPAHPHSCFSGGCKLTNLSCCVRAE